MLKLSILEFFLISIPESLVFIAGIYFLSKRFFTKKRLVIMALLFAIEAYFVRMLPIQFGIHLAINIIFSIVISVNIGKIPMKDAISYNMIMVIVLSISEFINVFLFIQILNINGPLVRLTPAIKAIYIISYLTLFVFNIFLTNKLMNKRK
ncbi:hypothetical protein EXQ42_19755 [Clostridium botulinum]|uniref:hypothetical protein n=1 Tax=Clostridium botulinum TaxID=1491 RepID=UPI001A927DFA|nr:hypothetical protein [Clostridium botulinum]MBO0523596.1 hypothetical protein [Clostridium botulinum]MBO0529227.1 hypothetical protein [Clostridium botulinum]MBO0532766.1 hypothetical protein [Clostridium botulinum]MBO0534069.1 hypothetical protein [Clostridium botulinum]MBO0540057.1 hypothetical protein [Clostridium botulinum]